MHYLNYPGPDWTYENQDGGCDELGTVFDIQKDGTVGVKWQNGYRGNYRYKDNNTYDVLLSYVRFRFFNFFLELEIKRKGFRLDITVLMKHLAELFVACLFNT